jgi:hypothetical protein
MRLVLGWQQFAGLAEEVVHHQAQLYRAQAVLA